MLLYDKEYYYQFNDAGEKEREEEKGEKET